MAFPEKFPEYQHEEQTAGLTIVTGLVKMKNPTVDCHQRQQRLQLPLLAGNLVSKTIFFSPERDARPLITFKLEYEPLAPSPKNLFLKITGQTIDAEKVNKGVDYFCHYIVTALPPVSVPPPSVRILAGVKTLKPGPAGLANVEYKSPPLGGWGCASGLNFR